jgi:hypothetical protein
MDSESEGNIITDTVPEYPPVLVHALDRCAVQAYEAKEGRERAPVPKPQPRKENPKVKK